MFLEALKLCANSNLQFNDQKKHQWTGSISNYYLSIVAEFLGLYLLSNRLPWTNFLAMDWTNFLAMDFRRHGEVLFCSWNVRTGVSLKFGKCSGISSPNGFISFIVRALGLLLENKFCFFHSQIWRPLCRRFFPNFMLSQGIYFTLDCFHPKFRLVLSRASRKEFGQSSKKSTTDL